MVSRGIASAPELHRVEMIEFSVVRSGKCRYARLTVTKNGCTVKAPRLMPLFLIKQFVRAHAPKIAKTLARFSSRVELVDSHNAESDYSEHKESARQYIHERLQHFSHLYGFHYKSVRIKNTSTRWGSCSKEGNLNFSYKLIHLPPQLADYVIVHELCHLLQMNHSSLFWQEVAKIIPDYKAKRRDLSGYALA